MVADARRAEQTVRREVGRVLADARALLGGESAGALGWGQVSLGMKCVQEICGSSGAGGSVQQASKERNKIKAQLCAVAVLHQDFLDD